MIHPIEASRRRKAFEDEAKRNAERREYTERIIRHSFAESVLRHYFSLKHHLSVTAADWREANYAEGGTHHAAYEQARADLNTFRDEFNLGDIENF